MDSLAAVLSKSIPAFLLVGVVLAGSFLWQRLAERLRWRKFPLLDKDYGGKKEQFLAMSAAIYEEGYYRFPEAIHRISTPDGEHIVIPQRYLDELRQRPDDEVDMLTAFMKAFENDYIQLFPGHRKTKIVNSVVKQELTRNLANINPGLSRTVVQTVDEVFPPCEDWTPVKIHDALLRIVAVASGHVFVGPDLCREEEYLRCAVDFTMDLVAAVPVLKRWHPWLRGFASRFEPQMKKVRAHRKAMEDFLGPVIAQRRAAKERGETMPMDCLQWMLDKCDPEGITNLTDLANMQLLLTMAAIHTTTLTTTFIIYDIVSRPEVILKCREEIKAVLKEYDGVPTTNALFHMKYVDSVMRESQRLNPPFIDAFRRFTLKPIKLKDGTVLPANALIEAANKAVLMDPALYPDPDRFNPGRFERLRTDPAEPDALGYKNREQYQFVSVTKENMSFGFGRHACPGRFFAANEIKLILSRMLLSFDMRLPEGEVDRNETVAVGAGVGPDPNREIMFRRARV